MVDTATLPCVTYEGDAARAGGAASHTIELLAALILMDFRMAGLEDEPDAWGFAGAIVGQTDALGSSYAVAKLYTGAEPGASIVRVMADRCMAKDVAPSLEWEPRAANQWADDLSKGLCAKFAPARRRKVNWADYRAIQEDYLMFSKEARGKAQLRPNAATAAAGSQV